jgi:hypothetical protein
MGSPMTALTHRTAIACEEKKARKGSAMKKKKAKDSSYR